MGVNKENKTNQQCITYIGSFTGQKWITDLTFMGAQKDQYEFPFSTVSIRWIFATDFILFLDMCASSDSIWKTNC